LRVWPVATASGSDVECRLILSQNTLAQAVG